MKKLTNRNLLSAYDFSRDEIMKVFKDTDKLKKGYRGQPLQDMKLAILFMKPSTRTRVSFEIGVLELGGHAVILGAEEVGLGRREAPRDVARVLSRMVEGIVARVFSHAIIEEMAQFATVPVVNGLSDSEHPCQAYADIYTLREIFGDLKQKHIVFIGDGNNVARSLLYTCSQFGLGFSLIAPSGFSLPADDFTRATQTAQRNGFKLTYTSYDHLEPSVLSAADCVYTDVWASMGKETEKAARLAVFKPFQINETVMAMAPRHAVFLHCLPAHRGEEVTDGVIESNQSHVFLQAENRLHVQKALLWNILT